jgi:hypothetical protein
LVLAVLFVLIVNLVPTAFASGSTQFTMDLSIDPSILGSNVVSILIFKGPDFQVVSLPTGSTGSSWITNDWCPVKPEGDDVANLLFANKKATYRVEFLLNPFSSPLEAWYIGAQSSPMGDYFLISPEGTIKKMLAPAKGAPSILKMRTASGKLSTTWGNIKNKK